jgi:hypothetical protein
MKRTFDAHVAGMSEGDASSLVVVASGAEGQRSHSNIHFAGDGIAYQSSSSSVLGHRQWAPLQST